MRKAWFCWELTAKGVAPVIHYDALPNGKNYLNPKIVGIPNPLIASWYWNADKSEIAYSFEQLGHDFPAPVLVEAVLTNVSPTLPAVEA